MTTFPDLTITVLGTGLMGFPMVQRLCQAGYRVRVWNRTRAKAEPLTASGATVHATPAQACDGADFIVSMLQDGTVVGHVLFGMETDSAVAGMRQGALVVDMASIQPQQAREHAVRLAQHGLRALDAPVSGGTVGAQAGTLAIMVGGNAQDFVQAQPLFGPLGRATLVGSHGAGQLAKLANQMIVGITIGAVAEALLLCEKGGADPAKVREAIAGGFADSRILQLHGQRMVERNFSPHGKMTVQLKDMRNALTTAQAVDFDAPITTLFEQLYADGVSHGLADLDHSALFAELARRNGMRIC